MVGFWIGMKQREIFSFSGKKLDKKDPMDDDRWLRY